MVIARVWGRVCVDVDAVDFTGYFGPGVVFADEWRGGLDDYSRA